MDANPRNDQNVSLTDPQRKSRRPATDRFPQISRFLLKNLLEKPQKNHKKPYIGGFFRQNNQTRAKKIVKVMKLK